MQLQSLLGFLGAAHLTSVDQAALPHDEGAAESVGFGHVMSSHSGLFAARGVGRLDADAPAKRNPDSSMLLAELGDSILGGGSFSIMALSGEPRSTNNSLQVANDASFATEIMSGKGSSTLERPPRLSDHAALQARHAALFSGGDSDTLASAAYGSTLAGAILIAKPGGGASTGATAADPSANTHGAGSPADTRGAGTSEGTHGAGASANTHRAGASEGTHGAGTSEGTRNAGSSADTHHLKGTSSTHTVSDHASPRLPFKVNVIDAGDRIRSQTAADRDRLRGLVLQQRGSAENAEYSERDDALAEANEQTAASERVDSSASMETLARGVEDLAGTQSRLSDPSARPVDSETNPSRHGTDSRDGLPRLTSLGNDKSPADTGFLGTEEVRHPATASDAHRDSSTLIRHGVPTPGSAESVHSSAVGSMQQVNGFVLNAEQRRVSARTAASGGSTAGLHAGLSQADAAAPSVLRNVIGRIHDGDNREAQRVPPAPAALPEATLATAEILALPNARTWTETTAKPHHPDGTTQPRAHGTPPYTSGPEGAAANPLTDARDEGASGVRIDPASEFDRVASDGNDAVNPDLTLRSQDVDAKSPSDPENRRERSGHISPAGSRADDSQNRNETAEHFSSDNPSSHPVEADGSPRQSHRADVEADAAGIDSSATERAIEDIATLLPEEMTPADLESASPESTASGDRSITAQTNSGSDIHRSAARRPLIGTTAWLRSVLTDGLETLDLGEVWKVLELQLEEGHGKMTVRAHRGDDKLTIAVSFTDPHLRALVAESAERIQEILQGQYDTAVELSLGGKGSDGAPKQRNDAYARRHTSTGETHALGASTSDDRARAARVIAAGSRHEWIG